MTGEIRTDSQDRFPAVETTLLRIAVGFRVVGAIWLTVLALITLLTEEPRIDSTSGTIVIVSAIAIAVTWTAVTVVLAYRKPAVLNNVLFLVVDVALAMWIAVTPNLVRSDIFFAGGYPISSPILVATTRGIAATYLPAILVAVSSVIGVRFASARAAEVLAINTLSPLVVAWGFRLIRIHDGERRQAEEALASERTKLARADERAEMAAQLHDSVLQTLALVQRKAPENRAVVRLARRQERELRAWLNGSSALGAANMLSTSLARAAEDTEEEHDVLVELSMVGDTELDERVNGLVAATREALGNAARFSGADRVFVLAEIDADSVKVAVRDRGCGFEPSSIPNDRRGVRESIVARLERLGGTATIRSAPGQGTEINMTLDTPA